MTVAVAIPNAWPFDNWSMSPNSIMFATNRIQICDNCKWMHFGIVSSRKSRRYNLGRATVLLFYYIARNGIRYRQIITWSMEHTLQSNVDNVISNMSPSKTHKRHFQPAPLRRLSYFVWFLWIGPLAHCNQIQRIYSALYRIAMNSMLHLNWICAFFSPFPLAVATFWSWFGHPFPFCPVCPLVFWNCPNALLFLYE